jgi:hypothetical protein
MRGQQKGDFGAASSSGGFLQTQASEAGLGFRLRDENAIEADKLQNLKHVAAGTRDGKAVACFACIAIKRDEGGKSGGVNAFDGAKIENDALAAHNGLEARDELMLLALYQLGRFAGDDGRRIGLKYSVHKNLLTENHSCASRYGQPAGPHERYSEITRRCDQPDAQTP